MKLLEGKDSILRKMECQRTDRMPSNKNFSIMKGNKIISEVPVHGHSTRNKSNGVVSGIGMGGTVIIKLPMSAKPRGTRGKANVVGSESRKSSHL
jgi:hypothetical protein